jgi:hypothetical protein
MLPVILSSAIRQEKKKKKNCRQIERGNKLSLFTDTMSIYTEHAKDSIIIVKIFWN